MAIGKSRVGLYFDGAGGTATVVTPTDKLPVTLGSDPFTISVATITIGALVGINTVTNNVPMLVNVNTFTADNISVTSHIQTTTAEDLIKPTTIKHYEVSTSTVGVWMPLTLTSKSYGYTIDCRADTITNAPPDLDFAMTSTGTPFNRILAGASYYEDNILLPTNTVFYFRVNEQTNSVVQLINKE